MLPAHLRGATLTPTCPAHLQSSSTSCSSSRRPSARPPSSDSSVRASARSRTPRRVRASCRCRDCLPSPSVAADAPHPAPSDQSPASCSAFGSRTVSRPAPPFSSKAAQRANTDCAPSLSAAGYSRSPCTSFDPTRGEADRATFPSPTGPRSHSVPADEALVRVDQVRPARLVCGLEPAQS